MKQTRAIHAPSKISEAKTKYVIGGATRELNIEDGPERHLRLLTRQ